MRLLATAWPAHVLARELSAYSWSEAVEQARKDLPRSGSVRVFPGKYPSFAWAAASQIGWALPYRWMTGALGEHVLSTSEGRRVALEPSGVVHQAIFRTLSGKRWIAWYSVRWCGRDLLGARLLVWCR